MGGKSSASTSNSKRDAHSSGSSCRSGGWGPCIQASKQASTSTSMPSARDAPLPSITCRIRNINSRTTPTALGQSRALWTPQTCLPAENRALCAETILYSSSSEWSRSLAALLGALSKPLWRKQQWPRLWRGQWGIRLVRLLDCSHE